MNDNDTRINFWINRLKVIIDQQIFIIVNHHYPMIGSIELLNKTAFQSISLCYKLNLLNLSSTIGDIYEFVNSNLNNAECCGELINFEQFKEQLKVLHTNFSVAWEKDKNILRLANNKNIVNQSKNVQNKTTYNFSYLEKTNMDLIESFIQETTEQIDNIEQGLVELEKNGFQHNNINNVFREFHTIKGNSGFIGLKEFNEIAHSCEYILDDFRSNPFCFKKEYIQVFFDVVDVFKKLNSNLIKRYNELLKLPNNSIYIDIDNYHELLSQISELHNNIKNSVSEIIKK